jgi:uncharacterized membrane protein YbhN (UPF0104 family)
MVNRLFEFIESFYTRLIVSLKKVNRWLITSISIGVMIVVLGLLVYRQRDIILGYQWQFRPLPIFLSFFVFSIALFWAAIVWGWIMNNLGISVSYKKHIRYYIVSNLAKRIPGTIWYIAGRFPLYYSEGVDTKITAIASGIEMILITLAGIIVVLMVSIKTIQQYHISPIYFIIILIIGVIVLHPKVIQWIIKRKNIDLTTINYFFILKGVLFYVLSWILGGIMLFEIGNIIYPIPNTQIIYFINAWTLVGLISTILFFSPSNFGITEIGLSLLLSNIIPSSIAVLIAIMSRILMILFEILWTGLFLWLKLPEKELLTRKD